ncbi:MAG: TIGR02594 family protein, partial [Planctomycetota bacterium]
DAYRKLPRPDRTNVINETNELFSQRTGVRRKLDPKREPQLCDRWLRIRDEVMQKRSQFKSLRSMTAESAYRKFTPLGIMQSVGERLISGMHCPWMDVARRQEREGIKEIVGEKHHHRIMEYFRTCDNLYATPNKARYTEKNGEEGVKWCSAFVNWCVGQVGITGTRNARALSWLQWGRPLKEPQVGAIVVMKTSRWRHVAFVDEHRGRLMMLGGNQRPTNGGSGPDRVSYRALNHSIILGYRWPT